MFFFFKQKTAYEIQFGDWSSGVCSSDLVPSPVSQSWTSTGLLEVANGLRLNSTLTVTFLPARFLGTRHEYEQVPPQPNSRLPLATVLPAWTIVNVGLGGWNRKPSPFWKLE